MAHLRADALLGALLGDGDTFPNPEANWGEGGAQMPIYKADEVPTDHPARFVVVRPPLRHDTDYYANMAARKMDSTYLVWAETTSDSLPEGHDFDAVLDPIFQRIVLALNHVTSTEAIGGHVLQVQIVDAYEPRPMALTATSKVGQLGVQLNLISTAKPVG